MPSLTDLVKNWWKQMLVVIIPCLLIVGIITFLKPRQYLSVATAVPASSFGADPSKVFNQNIQALYSALGTPDDLDMIVGTGNLDTVYYSVAREYNLFDHYKMEEKGDAALPKAASVLRRNSRVMKSEYGELKVKVWDTDANLAPQLANAIMDRLQSIHQSLQAAGNKSVVNGLVVARQKLSARPDSLGADEVNERIKQYDKLISEYQLMIDTKPPVLVNVEKAKPASWPDRPKPLRVITATAFLSLVFALLVALMMERRKQSRT